MCVKAKTLTRLYVVYIETLHACWRYSPGGPLTAILYSAVHLPGGKYMVSATMKVTNPENVAE